MIDNWWSSVNFWKRKIIRGDRLLAILLLLQTRGGITAQELAVNLEVSERTIYRDIKALGTTGVPIYAERVYRFRTSETEIG